VKSTLIWMLSGALVGIAIASYVVPRVLGWYVAPGGLPQGAQVQALVSIPEVVRYSSGKLIYWQWISAAVGATVGLLLSIVLQTRARRRRLEASAAAKAAVTQPPPPLPRPPDGSSRPPAI
jgi:hypothetical protein